MKDLRTHSEEASAGTDSQSVPSKLNTPPHSGEAVAGPSTLLLETLLSARTGRENQAWPGFAFCTCVLPRSCSAEQNISKVMAPPKP